MTKRIKKQLDELLTREDFPLLHILMDTVDKEGLYTELSTLCTRLHLKEEEDTLCLRRSKRHNVKTFCTLISGNNEERMLLQNISETGLKATISDNSSAVISPNKKVQIRIKVLRSENRKEFLLNARLLRIIETSNGYLDLCFDFVDPTQKEKSEIKEFIEVYTKERG